MTGAWRAACVTWTATFNAVRALLTIPIWLHAANAALKQVGTAL